VKNDIMFVSTLAARSLLDLCQASVELELDGLDAMRRQRELDRLKHGTGTVAQG